MRGFRGPAAAALVAVLAGWSAPAWSFDAADVVGFGIERRASAALAVLGISAVPNETASALTLDTGPDARSGDDFTAAQLGGGFTLSKSFPLYLEGYVGYDRYDPVFLISDGAEQEKLPVKWTGFAATGGVGWDFHLTEHVVLRPMVNVTLGQIVSDAAFVGKFIGDKVDSDVKFLLDGGLTAGGLGGSLSLVYNQRWANDIEADAILRHTQIHLKPIAGDRDVTGEADAITTALWTRLRFPTGYQAFGGPLRGVVEVSGSYFPGDQGDILNTAWMAQVGFGYEIDVSHTKIPLVKQGRIMFRYARGDLLEGYSLGLAVSF